MGTKQFYGPHIIPLHHHHQEQRRCQLLDFITLKGHFLPLTPSGKIKEEKNNVAEESNGKSMC